MSLGELICRIIYSVFGDSPHFCLLLLPNTFVSPALSVIHLGRSYHCVHFQFAEDGLWLSCKMNDENWTGSERLERIRHNFWLIAHVEEFSKS